MRRGRMVNIPSSPANKTGREGITLSLLIFSRLEARVEHRIQLIIDESVLQEYDRHYFSIHKRASKRPIQHPWHESINQWMVMRRPMMNALKQRWKDFIAWFIEKQGYSNLRIEKCELAFCVYYNTNRKHDPDNTCPKFIIDGLCESGFLTGDDSSHVTAITLRCKVDPAWPRTEIEITYWNEREE